MLFTTFNGVGGFGSVIYGFGATRTFVKGTDFNCNASICYGIGADNHQLFKDLQTTLNRYVVFGNFFAPLLVDGFLGDKTVAAVRVAAATADITFGATRETVAANAPALIERLTAFLAPIAPTPTQPIQPPTVATAQPQQQPQPVQPARPATQPVQPGQPAPQPGAQPTQPGAQATLTPGRVPVSPAAASLLPLAPTASKVPTWVWITAGVTGVVVVGLVGFALRKPAPEALGHFRGGGSKRFTTKQITGFLKAHREPLGIGFNDNYNKATYGITRHEYGAINRAMNDEYGMFPQLTPAGVRKALANRDPDYPGLA